MAHSGPGARPKDRVSRGLPAVNYKKLNEGVPQEESVFPTQEISDPVVCQLTETFPLCGKLADGDSASGKLADPETLLDRTAELSALDSEIAKLETSLQQVKSQKRAQER